MIDTTQHPPVVTEYTPSHRDAVRQLWVRRFGRQPHIDDWLTSAADPNRRAVCFVALKEAEVIGFGLAQHVSVEEATTTWPADATLPASWDTVCELYLGVVDAAYERNGIGRRLLERRLAWGWGWHADGATATAWHNPDGRDARGLLAAAGFETLATADDFYSDDRECPVCDGVCRCAASFVCRQYSGVDRGGPQ